MRGNSHVRFGGRSWETDPRQPGHRAQGRPYIRSLARRLGYSLAKTVTCNGRMDDPIARLIKTIRTTAADAVITPDVTHLGGTIPAALDRAAAVITIAPELA
ncbi:hypothetical protein ACQP0C_15185 [Nocardia sp. CA-129566]|uniref:hypothetical protein n=1 Tax=Nocardia sp. CA-129566 TaxID=3239976 RepID=UPI003D98146E